MEFWRPTLVNLSVFSETGPMPLMPSSLLGLKTRPDEKSHLTFDNGPDLKTTPYVLDCLAKHTLKCTFFVVGQKVCDTTRAIVQRATNEGHLIGNHTFTHTVPLGELDARTALEEFERTEDVLLWLR